MPKLIGTLCLLLIAVSVGCIMALRRRRMLMRLTWPANLGYYGMRGRVRRYFILRGWTLRDKESSEFDFLVSNGAGDFIVRCYPSGLQLLQKAFLDLSDVPNRYPGYSRKALLFVSAEQAPDSAIAEALAKKIFVFHYKSLDALTAIRPASPKTVGDLVTEMLGQDIDWRANNSDKKTRIDLF